MSWIPYLATDDPELEQNVYDKYEFRDLQGSNTYTLKNRELRPYQEFVRRYISTNTPYRRLFVNHTFGSGKTLTALAVAETLTSETSVSHVYVLTQSDGLLRNIKNELKQFIDTVPNRYTFETYFRFANTVGESNKPAFANRYEKALFIMDEVHNINVSDEQERRSIDKYAIILNFLHTSASNARVLLLSGSPMRDSPNEIVSLMNLVLPRSKQLTAPLDMAVFRQNIRGFVSYLKLWDLGVDTVRMGQVTDPLKYMPVVVSGMSQFQTVHYLKALSRDMTERTGVFGQSQQASLCVDLNGNYGQAFDRPEFIKRLTAFPSHALKLTFLKHYSCKYAEIVRSLLLYPSQLAFVYISLVQGSGLDLFRQILQCFDIPSIPLTGTTGGRAFQLIEQFNRKSNMVKPKWRVIVGSRAASEGYTFRNVQQTHIVTPFWNYMQVDQALARTNRLNAHRDLLERHPDAKNAIFLHTGIPIKDPTAKLYSFTNIDQNLINTLYRGGGNADNDDDSDDMAALEEEMDELMNSSSSSLGLGTTSEEDTETAKDDTWAHEIEIIQSDLQHTTVPSMANSGIQQCDQSLDLYMYSVAERKDKIIKAVERIMKECAVDCSINKPRNTPPVTIAIDGSRECDYTKCEYTCSRVDPDTPVDYSSYKIHFVDTYLPVITAQLASMVTQTMQIPLLQLIRTLITTTAYAKDVVEHALATIWLSEIPINGLEPKYENGVFYFMRPVRDDVKTMPPSMEFVYRDPQPPPKTLQDWIDVQQSQSTNLATVQLADPAISNADKLALLLTLDDTEIGPLLRKSYINDGNAGLARQLFSAFFFPYQSVIYYEYRDGRYMYSDNQWQKLNVAQNKELDALIRRRYEDGDLFSYAIVEMRKLAPQVQALVPTDRDPNGTITATPNAHLFVPAMYIRHVDDPKLTKSSGKLCQTATGVELQAIAQKYGVSAVNNKKATLCAALAQWFANHSRMVVMY